MELSSTIWLTCYFVVLLGLSGYGLHRYVMVYLFLKNSKKKPEPLSKFDELPVVTVQLPIFNELHVVERLIRAVGELEYPQAKLHIQVLDDSTDETLDICRAEVEKLAAKGFDIELIHRVDRTGFKAGALENGMAQAKGDFIYILDADFVPDGDALLQMIHFFTDERIGMIQTRWGHINRRYSLFTRIQAMFLDGHLIVEQTARSRSGRFFNFNGTAGMWRKSCIVDAGGWEHDTLTEDLDLSYRAQLKGWKFIFLNDVVTPAELPVDMDGFKSQQHRWAKGSIQTCKKMLGTVWRSDMPLIIKLEATAHLTSNFAYLLLVFLLVLIFPGMMPAMTWGRALLLDIPIFLMASVSVGAFYMCSQMALYPKGKWIREVMLLPMLLALGIGMSINNGKAVLEAIFNRESDFVRTPKYGIEKKRQEWRKSSYRALKSFAPLIEVALAFYFTFLVIYCLVSGMWMSVPFMMLFQVGFFYVSWDSLRAAFSFRDAEPKIVSVQG
jgi:cellulose synthase/poly-beta-1,6-N-acetylglucosamine synthase-like glycosyltransferase